MKKLILGFIILCCLWLMGCPSPDRDVYLRSYVSYYYDVEDIYIRGIADGRALITISEESNSKPKYLYNVGYNSKNEDKELYDKLCEKHNDMSYNRNVTIESHWPTTPHQYLAAGFVSLDIISDSDFDETHSEGCSLSDITMFYAVSPYPYILSGYKLRYDWNNADDKTLEIKNTLSKTLGGVAGKDSRHPISKLVSSLSQEDMYLLGLGYNYHELAYLEFTHKPTLSQSHTFTITLTADDGRVFTGTVPMEF